MSDKRKEINKMGELHCLIGLPRSGKSTVASKWNEKRIDFHHWKVEDISEPTPGNVFRRLNSGPRTIVCGDDIRLALTGDRYNYLIEDYVHAIKFTMIRTLLRKHDVLIDGTHTTEKSIMSVLRIDPNAKFYYVDTTVSECKKRALETQQNDLWPIIDRMMEGLIKLCGIQYDTNDPLKLPDNFYEELVAEKIMKAIDNLRPSAKEQKEKYEKVV